MSEMGEEWGPWRENAGNGCPVPRGTHVRVILDCGCKCEHTVDDLDFTGRDWVPGGGAQCVFCDAWCPPGGIAIAFYSIRKPRALSMLQNIAAGVKQPEKERA